MTITAPLCDSAITEDWFHMDHQCYSPPYSYASVSSGSNTSIAPFGSEIEAYPAHRYRADQIGISAYHPEAYVDLLDPYLAALGAADVPMNMVMPPQAQPLLMPKSTTPQSDYSFDDFLDDWPNQDCYRTPSITSSSAPEMPLTTTPASDYSLDYFPHVHPSHQTYERSTSIPYTDAEVPHTIIPTSTCSLEHGNGIWPTHGYDNTEASLAASQTPYHSPPCPPVSTGDHEQFLTPRQRTVVPSNTVCFSDGYEDYVIRSDIDSVSVESITAEARKTNCVYPKAAASRSEEQYKGRRWIFERECNRIGWALAVLNPVIQGKRHLIQKAVTAWRNTSPNHNLHSRNHRKRRTRPQECLLNRRQGQIYLPTPTTMRRPITRSAQSRLQ
ncbi:Hypothetical protein D9617_50g044350 [Elsinoe fawcettii]|nr:Hypothetical protein D9617_50g044350 [Elsinoe fawcettii]